MIVNLEAVGAGICGALASVFAKLAMASDKVPELCRSATSVMLSSSSTSAQNVTDSTATNGEDLCSSLALVMRLICFGLVFATNAIMWTFFVKSLQRTTTVVATITNTASNFFFTAISGLILFNETLPPMWWCGFACIVGGLLLINSDTASSDVPELTSEDKDRKLKTT